MGLMIVLSGVISALLITATVQGCDTAKLFFSVLFKSNQDSNLKLALFQSFMTGIEPATNGVESTALPNELHESRDRWESNPHKLSLLRHRATIQMYLTAYVTAEPTHQCGDNHDSMSDEQDLAKGVPGFE